MNIRIYKSLLDQRERSLQIVEENSGVPASTPLFADDGTTVAARDDDLVEQDHGRLSIIQNPLATGRSRFLTDSMGRRRECSKTTSILDLTLPRMAWSFINMGIQPASPEHDSGVSWSTRIARNAIEC